MKEYLQRREKARKMSNIMGVALTVCLHAVAVLFVSLSGMTYIWPPSEDSTFLLDFIEEVEQEPVKYGREPVAPKPDLEKPVEVVQKSESPITEPDPKNDTEQVKPDPFGDVETPTPEPKQPELDPRASFGGMAQKPSSATTPHVATDSSATFKAGQPDGNSKNTTAEGSANAHLEGREVLGYIQKPVYDKQEEGKVVVNIAVDVQGNVKNAYVGEGTTITDARLIQSAINSAYKVRFSDKKNLTAEDAGLQRGTITYIYKLK